MNTIVAFGLTFEVTDEELENGFTLLDQLCLDKSSPLTCISELSSKFGYTSAKATAVYARWASKHKPIF